VKLKYFGEKIVDRMSHVKRYPMKARMLMKFYNMGDKYDVLNCPVYIKLVGGLLH